jgi:hypothetical protein
VYVLIIQITNHPKQILLNREKLRSQEANRVMNAAYAGAEFVSVRRELVAPAAGSAAW